MGGSPLLVYSREYERNQLIQGVRLPYLAQKKTFLQRFTRIKEVKKIQKIDKIVYYI
ncbi:hypothetical protein SAMN04488508_1022 [Aquimarina spongiae]|uniref:Uncharacterized protein n=1 Tax=Aquimarina spongiae TaxID=570521 RepID=A0A1M6C934_9FLAO|nr:hypothetical protein SAMN04488508_1022 [Aquimarina spongiae]